MAFGWWADDGPLIVVLYLDPLSTRQLKKQQQKNFVNVGPLLTKLSRSSNDTISRRQSKAPSSQLIPELKRMLNITQQNNDQTPPKTMRLQVNSDFNNYKFETILMF